MKKFLLSLLAMVAFTGISSAQIIYQDFEGPAPYYGAFGGSNFEIVDNPMPGGDNTSDKVARTQKEEVNETWGGVYFPLGGTINFTDQDKEFSIDVFSFTAGTVTFKVEQGEQGAVEIPVQYTDPGNWQTLSFTFEGRNPDYKQIVVFMGFDSHGTDEWFYDNIKGPGFTAGGVVDVDFEIKDLAGDASSISLALSNDPENIIALTGEQGEGAVWTKSFTGLAGGSFITPSDLSYTIYVNGTAVPELTDVALNLMAGSAKVKISKNIGVAPAGSNLLTDGSFETDGPLVGRTANEWGMWSDNGSTAEVISGVVNAHSNQAGYNYALQVEQLNFPLENGKTYTVTFDAWASEDRVIAVTVEDPSNGYVQLGSSEDEGSIDGRSKWDVVVSTQRTTYTRTMTIDGMKGNTVTKFAFLLAQATGTVYISEVSIKLAEAVIGDAVTNHNLKVINVYPVPAENELNISGNYKSVVVYNVLGGKVREYTNVTNSINVEGLNSGVYMLRMSSVDGDTFTSKFVKK